VKKLICRYFSGAISARDSLVIALES
jgi:hypothetical protein